MHNDFGGAQSTARWYAQGNGLANAIPPLPPTASFLGHVQHEILEANGRVMELLTRLGEIADRTFGVTPSPGVAGDAANKLGAHSTAAVDDALAALNAHLAALASVAARFNQL